MRKMATTSFLPWKYHVILKPFTTAAATASFLVFILISLGLATGLSNYDESHHHHHHTCNHQHPKANDVSLYHQMYRCHFNLFIKFEFIARYPDQLVCVRSYISVHCTSLHFSIHVHIYTMRSTIFYLYVHYEIFFIESID